MIKSINVYDCGKAGDVHAEVKLFYEREEERGLGMDCQ